MTEAYWDHLDASAMVKLVANDADEEPGRVDLRKHFFSRTMHRATSFCVAETLSAFKTKWLRGRISQEEYVEDVREFFRLVLSVLRIDEVPLDVHLQQEAERLIKSYGIDFVDGIQIVTLRTGPYSVFIGGSRSLFVTADRSLARAARLEGARVWDCTAEVCPP